MQKLKLKSNEKSLKINFKIGQRAEYFNLTKHQIILIDEEKLTIKLINWFTGTAHDTGYGESLRLRRNEIEKILNSDKLEEI